MRLIDNISVEFLTWLKYISDAFLQISPSTTLFFPIIAMVISVGRNIIVNIVPMHTVMTSTNGNIFPVTGHLCGEFTAQRPVTRTFHVFFDLRLNKPLSKQSWGWWFETLSRPLWRHCKYRAQSYWPTFDIHHPYMATSKCRHRVESALGDKWDLKQVEWCYMNVKSNILIVRTVKRRKKITAHSALLTFCGGGGACLGQVDSPHKEPVMPQVFLCRELIMW